MPSPAHLLPGHPDRGGRAQLGEELEGLAEQPLLAGVIQRQRRLVAASQVEPELSGLLRVAVELALERLGNRAGRFADEHRSGAASRPRAPRSQGDRIGHRRARRAPPRPARALSPASQCASARASRAATIHCGSPLPSAAAAASSRYSHALAVTAAGANLAEDHQRLDAVDRRCDDREQFARRARPPRPTARSARAGTPGCLAGSSRTRRCRAHRCSGGRPRSTRFRLVEPPLLASMLCRVDEGPPACSGRLAADRDVLRLPSGPSQSPSPVAARAAAQGVQRVAEHLPGAGRFRQLQRLPGQRDGLGVTGRHHHLTREPAVGRGQFAGRSQRAQDLHRGLGRGDRVLTAAKAPQHACRAGSSCRPGGAASPSSRHSSSARESAFAASAHWSTSANSVASAS